MRNAIEWNHLNRLGSRPGDQRTMPVLIFSSSASNTRLSANINLSGKGKKESRSSDFTFESDLLDLNPLLSNCADKRSSFSPGDKDFNQL